MNINTAVTMKYVILSRWLRRKNKPNSNPIKPKTNPIKAKTNPIQTQTNPIRLPGKPLSFRIIWIDFKSGKRYNIVHKSNIWGAKTTGK
jgi:hypothetical protein